MTHEIFKKEYFDLYEFYTDSEEQFRKVPTITTGFCYKGGIKPVWCLISAFQSEEEALSTINEKPIIDLLEELRQEVLDAHFMEADYFVHMINCKIREIKKRNDR